MKPPTPPAHNISLRTTRMLMRVFSLENDQSQRQHNGQTHPQLGSMPGKCGCICTVCSAPSGARNVQGQRKGQWTGECCPGWHPPQLQKLLPESCLWFNQCHGERLSPMLPSLTCRSSHTAVLVTEIARSRGWEGGGHTHTSDTFSVSLWPPPAASNCCWCPLPTLPHPLSILLPSFLQLSHCCQWQVSATVWRNSSW